MAWLLRCSSADASLELHRAPGISRTSRGWSPIRGQGDHDSKASLCMLLHRWNFEVTMPDGLLNGNLAESMHTWHQLMAAVILSMVSRAH